MTAGHVKILVFDVKYIDVRTPSFVAFWKNIAVANACTVPSTERSVGNVQVAKNVIKKPVL